MHPRISVSDVFIRLDQSTDAGEKQNIIDELQRLDGVMTSVFNTRNLILVTYDPGKASSLALVRAVRGKGYNAQLIGM
jgi:copper chaperone CopZ